jgi:hypothetical protein
MANELVQQPYALVDFIPQSGIYEFGYRTPKVAVCKDKWLYIINKVHEYDRNR